MKKIFVFSVYLSIYAGMLAGTPSSEQNKPTAEAIKKEATDVLLTSTPLYGLSEAMNAIINVPGLRIDLPKIDIQKVYPVFIQEGKVEVRFPIDDVARKTGKVKSMTFVFPKKFKDIFDGKVPVGLFYHLNAFGMESHLNSEMGGIYIPVPRVSISEQKELTRIPKNQGYFECVTNIPFENQIAALVAREDPDAYYVMGIDQDTGKCLWEFPIKVIVATQRLTWINNHLLLATVYGRRNNSFAVIDITSKKVLAEGTTEMGGNYFIEDNALFAFLPDTNALSKLFAFKTP